MEHEERNGFLPLESETPQPAIFTTNGRKLQKLGEARRRQGISVRCVAQRLNKTVSDIRAQEDEDADILVSELYRWQQVLEVPIEELLEEAEKLP